MRKGKCFLYLLLASIVCLSGSVAFAAGKMPDSARPAEQDLQQAQQDERIKYTVEERLRTDGRMDWEVLDVEVSHQGHVTLYGEVETADQKGLATVIANTVPGVTEILNRILVDTAISKNHHLQKAVWSTLRNVDALRQQTDTLRVRARNGVVTLSGSVNTKGQKIAAGKAAKSVFGIKKINNAIHVGALPFQTEQEKLRKEGREEMR